MNVFPKLLCGWSWEENKLFELALAVVDEEDPQRWEVVAALLGGKKSAEDVQKHYVILLEDLQVIESGKLDHKLGQPQNYVQVVDHCTQSVCWTDENNKYVNEIQQLLKVIDCFAFTFVAFFSSFIVHIDLLINDYVFSYLELNLFLEILWLYKSYLDSCLSSSMGYLSFADFWKNVL